MEITRKAVVKCISSHRDILTLQKVNRADTHHGTLVHFFPHTFMLSVNM